MLKGMYLPCVENGPVRSCFEEEQQCHHVGHCNQECPTTLLDGMSCSPIIGAIRVLNPIFFTTSFT